MLSSKSVGKVASLALDPRPQRATLAVAPAPKPSEQRASGRRAPSAAGGGRVSLAGVSVAFGRGARRVQAVRDVSLHIAPGEFVSIIGPSGCGKSTLLEVIAGFTAPSAGQAQLDGQAIVGPGPERGVVFQQYSLFPWLSVLGNVEFGLRAHGFERSRRRAVAREFLERAGLQDFMGHYPEELSGGMRQRVGIVRALAVRPQVLLLDEPFGALDAQTRSVMQQILLEMWQSFRTSVLFITHDTSEAVLLSDRVYVMSPRPGQIQAELLIPLPRPRDALAPEISNLVRTLQALVRGASSVQAAQ
jgi:NitT/TauT family transport system ATP-binding protein